MNTFERKVRGMKPSKIILSMVAALENPKFGVDMDEFGDVKDEGYSGCAATHLISYISGELPRADYVHFRWEGLKADLSFVRTFQFAIDSLRFGMVEAYNNKAEDIGIWKIPEHYTGKFPILLNTNWKDQLDTLRELANQLKQEGL